MSARRTARGLPSRRVTVLLGLAASALLIGAMRPTWVEASAPDLAGTVQQVAVPGAEAAPAVLALALVAIAASLATALSSRWLRWLTGPALVLAGLGAILAALGVTSDPGTAAGGAVAATTGMLGSAVEARATAWPLLSLVPALAVVAVGALTLAAGGTWPLGTRYRSPALAAATGPEQDPAAAWDALTRGEDPSLAGEDEAPGGAPAPGDPAPGAGPGPGAVPEPGARNPR